MIQVTRKGLSPKDLEIFELLEEWYSSHPRPLAVVLDRSLENTHPLKLEVKRVDGGEDGDNIAFKSTDQLIQWFLDFQVCMVRAQSIISHRVFRSANKTFTLKLGYVEGTEEVVKCRKIQIKNYHFIDNPSKKQSLPKLFDNKYQIRLEVRENGQMFLYQYKSAIFRHNSLTHELTVELTMRVVSVTHYSRHFSFQSNSLNNSAIVVNTKTTSSHYFSECNNNNNNNYKRSDLVHFGRGIIDFDFMIVSIKREFGTVSSREEEKVEQENDVDEEEEEEEEEIVQPNK
ncbi:hypothetical protein DFA_08319 [Cavenderia fasciculata]|uniref:Uncharacterized protein n=1 Tax=Cavenderia fasciculata TaxID=261658 RepID=F4Q5R6_CACFS|nr:uncharacterized protein DFA_08319 [Cavenderia fasciculata]EGG17325.1 hypothetical protein DFA_08319 [Cavenderia fasciculata]|eukprot:XP_004355809.1 hypothetical protein DFA_08319 [Cavenderia fasciculata]